MEYVDSLYKPLSSTSRFIPLGLVRPATTRNVAFVQTQKMVENAPPHCLFGLVDSATSAIIFIHVALRLLD